MTQTQMIQEKTENLQADIIGLTTTVVQLEATIEDLRDDLTQAESTRDEAQAKFLASRDTPDQSGCSATVDRPPLLCAGVF